jgi:hypothetical protein
MMTPRSIGARPAPLTRAAIVVFLALALALSWLGSLDSISKRYVDEGLKRALVTFALARTANAVISVVQSTTLSSVVVSASPGQALDPLNDVVEDFSNLMLAASVSLVAQKLLISVGALHAISAALTVAILGWAAFALRGRIVPAWLARALVLLLFVRFAVPIAALGSEAAFALALSGPYAQAQNEVQLTLEPPASAAPPVDAHAGVLDRIKEWLARKGSDLRKSVDSLKSRMEGAIAHMVTLMAIFVVQTAILPLLFLWLSYRLFGGLLRWHGALARPGD